MKIEKNSNHKLLYYTLFALEIQLNVNYFNISPTAIFKVLCFYLRKKHDVDTVLFVYSLVVGKSAQLAIYSSHMEDKK